MYMCVYIYIYISIYIYIYISTYLYLYLYIHIRMCTGPVREVQLPGVLVPGPQHVRPQPAVGEPGGLVAPGDDDAGHRLLRLPARDHALPGPRPRRQPVPRERVRRPRRRRRLRPAALVGLSGGTTCLLHVSFKSLYGDYAILSYVF